MRVMRVVGYLLLFGGLIEVMLGVYGWALHVTVAMGIVCAGVGTWWEHRKE